MAGALTGAGVPLCLSGIPVRDSPLGLALFGQQLCRCRPVLSTLAALPGGPFPLSHKEQVG